MSETIGLELLVKLLRDVQAEQHALNRLIREELGELKGSMLTRAMEDRMLRTLLDYTRAFEAQVETRFDALNVRFDVLEALIRSMRGSGAHNPQET